MGWSLFLVAIMTYVASQVSAVAANVLLSEWSNSNEGLNFSTIGAYESRSSNLQYLWMYGVVGAGQGKKKIQ
jgi:hypothetical protein